MIANDLRCKFHSQVVVFDLEVIAHVTPLIWFTNIVF